MGAQRRGASARREASGRRVQGGGAPARARPARSMQRAAPGQRGAAAAAALLTVQVHGVVAGLLKVPVHHAAQLRAGVPSGRSDGSRTESPESQSTGQQACRSGQQDRRDAGHPAGAGRTGRSRGAGSGKAKVEPLMVQGACGAAGQRGTGVALTSWDVGEKEEPRSRSAGRQAGPTVPCPALQCSMRLANSCEPAFASFQPAAEHAGAGRELQPAAACPELTWVSKVKPRVCSISAPLAPAAASASSCRSGA